MRSWAGSGAGLGQWRASFKGHCDWVTDAALVQTQLVTCSSDCCISVWDSQAQGQHLRSCEEVLRDVCIVGILATSLHLRSKQSPQKTNWVPLVHYQACRHELMGQKWWEELAVCSTQMLRMSTFMRAVDLCAGNVTPRATLYTHTDYVTCLAAAKSVPYFVSGGLRGQVNLWDLQSVLTSSSKAKLCSLPFCYKRFSARFCIDESMSGKSGAF